MIKSFRNKNLQNFFNEGVEKGIPPKALKKIRIRLEVINKALEIGDIQVTGYALHELKGDRKGIWAIKTTKNWRITFRFEDGNAYDVDYEDYH